MWNSSIGPIATTQRHRGPGSDGNEGVFHIPQSSSITEASTLECLVSYQDILWGFSFPLLRRCSRCILQYQPTRLKVPLVGLYMRERERERERTHFNVFSGRSAFQFSRDLTGIFVCLCEYFQGVAFKINSSLFSCKNISYWLFF